MIKKILISIFILVVILIVGSIYVYRSIKDFLNTPFKGQRSDVVVFIKKGMNETEISKLLYENGLISSEKRFFYFLRFLHRRKNLTVKAGEYLLSPDMSPYQIAEKLIKREVVRHKITIPEGLRYDEIAKIFENEGLLKAEEFIYLCKDRVFLSSIGIEAENCEGYLFPQTYMLEKGEGAKEILKVMYNEFRRQVGAGYIEKAKEMGLDLYKVIIIASMVEKEARLDSERPIIASVILNRLRRRIGLYIDATVIYGLIREKGGFNGDLTRKDLLTPTRYNTYIIKGLPPTPICNPGIKSINAVLTPANTDYLYYVSKNDGSHFFCKTLECHNKAVYKYQIKNKIR